MRKMNSVFRLGENSKGETYVYENVTEPEIDERRYDSRSYYSFVNWSAKKNIMDKTVYNDDNEKIGNVDDVIFSRNKSAASFAVIGVGGFLGVGTHDVAVPLSQIKHEGDKLILPGATKDALKAMPEFKYATSERTDERTSSNRTGSDSGDRTSKK